MLETYVKTWYDEIARKVQRSTMLHRQPRQQRIPQRRDQRTRNHKERTLLHAVRPEAHRNIYRDTHEENGRDEQLRNHRVETKGPNNRRHERRYTETQNVAEELYRGGYPDLSVLERFGDFALVERLVQAHVPIMLDSAQTADFFVCVVEELCVLVVVWH